MHHRAVSPTAMSARTAATPAAVSDCVREACRADAAGHAVTIANGTGVSVKTRAVAARTPARRHTTSTTTNATTWANNPAISPAAVPNVAPAAQYSTGPGITRARPTAAPMTHPLRTPTHRNRPRARKASGSSRFGTRRVQHTRRRLLAPPNADRPDDGSVCTLPSGVASGADTTAPRGTAAP